MTSVGWSRSADDIRDGERLAGAGDAEEGLVAIARVEGAGELLDGLRLVALRGVGGGELEGHGGWNLEGGVQLRQCRSAETGSLAGGGQEVDLYRLGGKGRFSSSAWNPVRSPWSLWMGRRWMATQ